MKDTVESIRDYFKIWELNTRLGEDVQIIIRYGNYYIVAKKIMIISEELYGAALYVRENGSLCSNILLDWTRELYEDAGHAIDKMMNSAKHRDKERKERNE